MKDLHQMADRNRFPAAHDLLEFPTTGGRRQCNLRRALHSIYLGVLDSLAAACAHAIIGDSHCQASTADLLTAYQNAASSADGLVPSAVDTSGRDPQIRQFAQDAFELQHYRGIVDVETGLLVEGRHVQDALAQADRAMQILECCDAEQVWALADALNLIA